MKSYGKRFKTLKKPHLQYSSTFIVNGNQVGTFKSVRLEGTKVFPYLLSREKR